jgi:dihydrofolate reductase
MTISIIVAYDSNNLIGKNNKLIWHLPADLAHFKRITTHHTIIMGRKTYDSIGRPLPNRRNIIITRNSDLEIAGCEVVNSFIHTFALVQGEEEVFIIGGAEIYKQALPFVDMIYATEVDYEFEGGDAYFPKLDTNEWKEISRDKHHKDEKNAYNFDFVIYKRKK